MDKNETAPRVETTHKLGNTTYVVNGFYASKGATATEKIKRLLDRETKKKTGENLTLILTHRII